MSRPRRLLLVVLLLAAVLAAAGVAAWLQGGEWLRRTLEAELQKRVVPVVRIAGPVGLSLQPRPAVTVGGLSLTDAEGRTVLAVRELEAAFDHERLFGDSPSLTSLRISGVSLVLRPGASGRWNVQGWLREAADGPEQAGGAGFAIERLVIDDASVRLEGETAAALEDLRLEVGPVAPGAAGTLALEMRAVGGASLPMDLRIELSGAYRLAPDGARAEALRLAASGRAGAWRIERSEARAGSMQWSADGRLRAEALAWQVEALGPDAPEGDSPATVAVDARLTGLGGGDGVWRGEALAVDLHAERAAQTLAVRLASPAPTLDAQGWRLPGLVLGAQSAGRAPAIHLTLEGEAAGGQASARPRGEAGGGAPATEGQGGGGQVDEVPGPDESAPIRLHIARAGLELPHPAGRPEPLSLAFAGSAGLDPVVGAVRGTLSGGFDRSRFDGRFRYDPAAPRPLAFELTLDRLDLDAYLPPDEDTGGKAGGEPPDLTAWRTWPVEAELHIGELRFKDMVGEDARLRLSGGD